MLLATCEDIKYLTCPNYRIALIQPATAVQLNKAVPKIIIVLESWLSRNRIRPSAEKKKKSVTICCPVLGAWKEHPLMKDLTPEISSLGGGLFTDFSANNFQSEAIIIWHDEGVMQQILKTVKNVNEQDPRQFLWDVLGMVGVKNDVIISIGDLGWLLLLQRLSSSASAAASKKRIKKGWLLRTRWCVGDEGWWKRKKKDAIKHCYPRKNTTTSSYYFSL